MNRVKKVIKKIKNVSTVKIVLIEKIVKNKPLFPPPPPHPTSPTPPFFRTSYPLFFPTFFLFLIFCQFPLSALNCFSILFHYIIMFFHSLQTNHMYPTLKRRGNDRFQIVSMWTTRGMFVGLFLSASAEYL